MSAHRLANQMRRYFVPASTFPPPGSVRGQTGNRNVTQTGANSPNTTPTDTAVVQLVNGVANWKFKTNFTKPPNITATAITTLTSGGNPVTAELVSQGFGSTVGAIINSTAGNNDNRLVFVHAIQAND